MIERNTGFTLAEVPQKIPSPQRGEGAFVGDKRAVQMRVRGSIIPDKNFSPFTFHFSRKRAAFTLAEVLITLGIIGVVAAITMPILIKSYQKQVAVNRLKQTYGLISQAVKMAEINNDPLSNWEVNEVANDEERYENGKKIAEKYFLPYLKHIKTCTSGSHECFGKGYHLLNGTEREENYLSTNCFGFILSNGTALCIKPSSDKNIEIYVDINGKQPPNIIGKDLFDIIVNAKAEPQKASVYLYNQYEDDLVAPTKYQGCHKSRSGYNCGAMIMRNGWKIGKDYPW